MTAATTLQARRRRGLMFIGLSVMEFAIAIGALAAYRLDWFGDDNMAVLMVAFVLAASALVLSHLGMRDLKSATETNP